MAWNPNVPTVTNLVQDDLNAIRENFQHLAPLAPYIQAIRDSRIVEMGSNSNGTYVRWENGLQVCRAILSWSGLSPTTRSVQALTIYQVQQSWTYPASFTSPPSVVGIAPIQNGALETVTTSAQPGTSACNLFIKDIASYSSATSILVAIGVWK